MLKILLVSHSKFAGGIKEAAEFIMGKQEHLYFINAYVNDETYEEQLQAYMDTVDYTRDKLIIVSDLFGGSVNQKTLSNVNLDHVKLVTGLCLPMLLELLMLNENNVTDEAIRKIVETSKDSILFVNDKIQSDQKDDFDF